MVVIAQAAGDSFFLLQHVAVVVEEVFFAVLVVELFESGMLHVVVYAPLRCLVVVFPGNAVHAIYCVHGLHQVCHESASLHALFQLVVDDDGCILEACAGIVVVLHTRHFIGLQGKDVLQFHRTAVDAEDGSAAARYFYSVE